MARLNNTIFEFSCRRSRSETRSEATEGAFIFSAWTVEYEAHDRESRKPHPTPRVRFVYNQHAGTKTEQEATDFQVRRLDLPPNDNDSSKIHVVLDEFADID